MGFSTEGLFGFCTARCIRKYAFLHGHMLVEVLAVCAGTLGIVESSERPEAELGMVRSSAVDFPRLVWRQYRLDMYEYIEWQNGTRQTADWVALGIQSAAQ